MWPHRTISRLDFLQLTQIPVHPPDINSGPRSGSGRSCQPGVAPERQTGQAPQLRRYCPGQPGAIEPQLFQVGEAPQFGWYLPSQLVPRKVKYSQVGQAAQLRRYLAGQLVVIKDQIREAGEVAQLAGYLAGQLVLMKPQPCQA